MTQAGWPDRLAQVVAGEVRRYRKERRMSAQQVSDRCAKLGMDIPRSTLADLENGRRPKVTLAELLVLAAALEVPPLLLAIPLARSETVEVLPGQDVPTWEAALWWRGEGYAIENLGSGPVVVRHPDVKNPADFVLEHQELVSRWTATTQAAADAVFAQRRSVPGEERDLLGERWGNLQKVALSIEENLASLRKMMRGLDLTPPSLPPALEHLDAQYLAG